MDHIYLKFVIRIPQIDLDCACLFLWRLFFLILRSPLAPAEEPAGLGGFLVLGDRELKVQARQETPAGVLVHLDVHVVVTLEKNQIEISSNSNYRLENQSRGGSCLLECSPWLLRYVHSPKNRFDTNADTRKNTLRLVNIGIHKVCNLIRNIRSDLPLILT